MDKRQSLAESQAATPEDKRAFVHEVFESISDDYDRMNDVESFGLHRGWKRTLIKSVVQAVGVGGTAAATASAVAVPPTPPAFSDETPDPHTPFVLDVACGTGDIALGLAEALPSAQVVGLDFSENMLAVARRRAADCPPETPLPDFIHGDALALPYADKSIDALTISFGLRNLPDYAAALREFNRVLKPGGKLFCLEASYPTSPLVKPFFKLYFKHLMPRMAALVVGHRQQYQWLNDSTEAFLSKPELATLMQDCGFTDVSYRSFFMGVAALHEGERA